MDSEYKRELDIAFSALGHASRLSQYILHRPLIHNEKRQVVKSDLSPVTIADFAIQALLVATFKHHFPDDHFVGEEDASQLRQDLVLLEQVWELLIWISSGEPYDSDSDSDDEDGTGGDTSWQKGPAIGIPRRVRKKEFERCLCVIPKNRMDMCDLIDECAASSPTKTGRVWVFDPIDGTKTYIRGEVYAINIGLLVDGVQTLGVVGCPNFPLNPPTAPILDSTIDTKGSIFYAVKGFGAWKAPLHDYDEPPTPHERLPRCDRDIHKHKVGFLTSTNVGSAVPGFHSMFAKRLGLEYPGSDILPWVVRWVILAQGLAHVCPWVYNKPTRFAKVWDHAGAMLLYEEVGGKVTDIQGAPIDFTAGRKMTANMGFIAAPAVMHFQILKETQTIIRSLDLGIDYLGDAPPAEEGERSRICTAVTS